MHKVTICIYLNAVKVFDGFTGKCLASWQAFGHEGIRGAVDEALKLYPHAHVKGCMP